MKNFNFIVMPLYVVSIIFALSSSSWMMIWISMEMNLLTFIFLILKKKTNMSMESSMKYFLIQSSGSLIFLFSLMTNMTYYNQMFTLSALVPPLALILKSGMAPLHTWTPEIVSKFNYQSLYLFITFQKIVPLTIMFSSWSDMMSWIMIFNIMIGSIGGLTQSSIYKMILYSSINNSGWMIMSLMESMFMFTLYFLIYSMMNFMVINFLEKNQIKWIIQIKSYSHYKKYLFSSMMLSLSGLPPFMGFLTKWLVISMLYTNYKMIIMISLMFSILTMFFYIKCSITLLSSSFWLNKWNINYPTPSNIFLVINIFSPLIYFTLT
uniref:NADH-ubiquinone oxidoreductase chain 2 n=1 Tax=Freysuila caesalpiniae TaxID=2008487 RepID=A0A344A2B8_9HEMI|nr:NADH dehydrogenase subunit 2 [Freysuila caesalpiniae]AWU48909.1 NADH dehydrogenase subunit 2 [Freysuila caesalpiniae]